jgi:hypothetical protein
MNTGIRRFILRLAVGLLAFLIGIGVAWAIGGLNPFQSYSGADSYRRPCPHSHRWTSMSVEQSDFGTTFEESTVYEGGSCPKKRMMSNIPPPPPPPAAPATTGGS